MSNINLRPEFSPHKSYLVFRAIMNGLNSIEELKRYVGPEVFGEANIEVIVRNLEELNLIERDSISNEMYSCVHSSTELDDERKFSFALGSMLAGDEKFMAIYSVLVGTEKFCIHHSMDDLIALINSGGYKITRENILAFRLWFKYTGMGHYIKNDFIIFPFERLRAILKYDTGIKSYSKATMFLEYLGETYPEFDYLYDQRNVTEILSEIFLLLETEGTIGLEYIPDSKYEINFKFGNTYKKYSKIDFSGVQSCD